MVALEPIPDAHPAPEARPERLTLPRAPVVALESVPAVTPDPEARSAPVTDIGRLHMQLATLRAHRDEIEKHAQRPRLLQPAPAPAVEAANRAPHGQPPRGDAGAPINESTQVRRQRGPTVQAHTDTHGRAATQEEIRRAGEWLNRRVQPGQHGTSLPVVADSVARQRLTGEPALSKYHPDRYSQRPPLPTAIQKLAPNAAPGYHRDRAGPIPDEWNTGACRTRDGAEQAAKVLEQVIDDIARQHFDGHTDPRDYKPGWLKPSIERAKNAAMQAWQEIRDSVIKRMVTAAAGPEAIEIRRRQRQEAINQLARERAARTRRARIATVPSRPVEPDQGRDRWN